ncbi:MAG: PKD domain-containing protein [Chloroflexota bacterium]
MKTHQIYTLIGITLLCVLAFMLNHTANATTEQVTLNGTYQGNISMSEPMPLGVLDLALAVTQEGDQLSGQIDGTYTLFSENTPPLQGSIDSSTPTTPTFTLTSANFSDQIAGKEVARTVTLTGDVIEDGSILRGTYTEEISGFTPQPMTTQGRFIVSRPSTAAPMTVDLAMAVDDLQPGQETSVTATVHDQDGQPMPGVLVVFQGVYGTVAPTNGVTDGNGQVTVTFTMGTLAERAAVTALAESAVASISVQPGSAPVADFTPSVQSGDLPLTVVFTNNSQGSITSYAWDFGDGNSSTETSPTHVYTTAGVYNATLTVTGPNGSDSHSNQITVNDPDDPETPEGDINGDGAVNIFDLQILINMITHGTPEDPALYPLTQWQRAELNGDGAWNIFDLQLLINSILQ